MKRNHGWVIVCKFVWYWKLKTLENLSRLEDFNLKLFYIHNLNRVLTFNQKISEHFAGTDLKSDFSCNIAFFRSKKCIFGLGRYKLLTESEVDTIFVSFAGKRRK